ncbi:MAG: M48 family metallopeptidase [Gammaproteobacteria bacterium AqS3]|nr:M48 family metallopeptidase [Gammaproteobacteria bacterium AqS3]
MAPFDFPLEVIRTNRKRSVAIQILGDTVRVRAPKTLSERRIHSIIAKRTAWIKRKLREQAERPALKPKEYVSGEAFQYLGRNYRLKVVKTPKASTKPSIKMQQGYLVATIPETTANPQRRIKALLRDWYQVRAEQRLKEKTERLAKVVGVTPRSITVRDYKSRWGSCSVKGDISYNWQIILAPHRIIDYVVIHELCHILEHNHSPQYWKQVEKYVPDWRDCRAWLKDNPIIF